MESDDGMRANSFGKLFSGGFYLSYSKRLKHSLAKNVLPYKVSDGSFVYFLPHPCKFIFLKTYDNTISHIMNLIRTIFFVVTAIVNYQTAAQPIISSFSPDSGPVGTIVTIFGSNFSTVADSNIVYFGNIRAAVTAASDTSLIVTSPASATTLPISVTRGGLIGFARIPFYTTFTNYGTSGKVLGPQVKIPVSVKMDQLQASDVDGDSKLDVVGINNTLSGFSVFKNTSTIGNISFGTRIDSLTPHAPNEICIGDLDGDGKQDVVVLNGNDTISCYLNTSIPGIVSFRGSLDIPVGANATSLIVSDMNGDGKLDLAFINNATFVLSVFKNTTSGGNVSFATRSDFFSITSLKITVSDFNGDGKNDVAQSKGAGVYNYISVSLNTGNAGTLDFGPTADFYTHIGLGFNHIISSDINADGRPDIIAASSKGRIVCLLRNISTAVAAAFVLDTTINYQYSANDYIFSVGSGELTGDLQPEIFTDVGNYGDFVIKNNSSQGKLYFSSLTNYGKYSDSYLNTVCDLDNDGKQDVVFGSPFNFGTPSITVIRNVSNEPYITSFTPTIAGRNDTVKITGNYLANAIAISFGNAPAQSFIVNSPTSIFAIVDNGSSGSIKVTTPFGEAAATGFVYNSTPVPSTPPIINGFSPLSGPVGTVVTITGSNFSAGVSNNTVFFGQIKATISSATTTSISVTVPPGAIHQPITVTNGFKLTTASLKQFVVTFPGAGDRIYPQSFVPVTEITSDTTKWISTADIDGDGKTDLMLLNKANAIKIFKNKSVAASDISFDEVLTLNSPQLNRICFHDLDGDGKSDIIGSSENGFVYVYKNLSTTGNITFGVLRSFVLGPAIRAIAIRDFDADGRPDIACLGSSATNIYILKNTTVSDSIILASPVSFTTSITASELTIDDIDGDLKPDIILTRGYYGDLAVYRNTSASSVLSFQSPTSWFAGGNHNGVATADFNGDGKADIALAANGSMMVTLKNTSTVNNVLLETAGQCMASTMPQILLINDLDGDARPDIAITNAGSNTSTFSLYKNTSIATDILCKPRVELGFPFPSCIATADFDNDGKPDIVVSSDFRNKVTFYHNKTGENLYLCPGGSGTIANSNIGISDNQWQVDNGNGFTNLINNSNYSGVTTQSLQVNNIPSSFQGNKYRCFSASLSLYSKTTVLKIANSWIGSVSNAWENASNWSCGTIPNSNTDVIIDAGASILISSNVTINTINIQPKASVTVVTGYTLTVRN